MTKNRMYAIVKVCAIVAIFTAVMAVMIRALSGSETHTSAEDANRTIASVYCEAEDPEESFFSSDKAVSENYKVKFTFKDDKIDKVQLNYSAVFPDKQTADTELSRMHADYNIYMSKTKIYMDDLSPSFTLFGDNIDISVFMNNNTFTSETETFAFLKTSEFIKAKGYAPAELKKLYEEKDFSCKNDE